MTHFSLRSLLVSIIALELKTELEIDPESSMGNKGHSSRSEKIITIIGNLLENTLEASALFEGRKKYACR